MATTTIAKDIPAPKKRSEGLIIALYTITNAKTPLSAGCFYGALIAILVGALYPTLSGLNALQAYLTSNVISGIIGAHLTNTFSFTAFLGIELYSAIYGLLFGGIMAFIAGAALPATIENGTIDLALARPISRTRYYLEIWLGVLLSGLLMGMIIVFFVWVASLFVKNSGIDWQWLWITQLVQFAFFAFAIGIGMLFGSFMNASRAAGGIAVGIIALGYLVNVFGNLSDSLNWLLKINPFYYAPATQVLIAHDLTWWYPWALVAVGLLCTAIGLLIFNKRDLPGA